MGDLTTVLIVIGAVIVAIVVIYFQWQANKKKVAELTAAAAERGWKYDREDRGRVHRFKGTPFGEGRNRMARHILLGPYRGRTMLAFEYSYQELEGSGDRRRTKTYRFTVVGIGIPSPRPTLEITREGWGRKLLGMVGVRDLQLESEDFNKTFHIRAENDKFAYDILHPRMMEWMLADQRTLSIPFRFERGDLVVWTDGPISLAGLDHLANYACDILDRTPGFVWKS
jgi:Protein of unknown function (DUF3137)